MRLLLRLLTLLLCLPFALYGVFLLPLQLEAVICLLDLTAAAFVWGSENQLQENLDRPPGLPRA